MQVLSVRGMFLFSILKYLHIYTTFLLNISVDFQMPGFIGLISEVKSTCTVWQYECMKTDDSYEFDIQCYPLPEIWQNNFTGMLKTLVSSGYHEQTYNCSGFSSNWK